MVEELARAMFIVKTLWSYKVHPTKKLMMVAHTQHLSVLVVEPLKRVARFLPLMISQEASLKGIVPLLPLAKRAHQRQCCYQEAMHSSVLFSLEFFF